MTGRRSVRIYRKALRCDVGGDPLSSSRKAQPKEMLLLRDKPIIQYGVEEAIQYGITNIITVTGRGKTAIEDHFDITFESEHLLETRKKKELLMLIPRRYSELPPPVP